MKSLQYITIPDFVTEKGEQVSNQRLSYEVGGAPLGDAPIVLVCHALTGNSSVSGPDGWWSSLIGEGKTIDTSVYSILAFNIPGNGYDGSVLSHPQLFTLHDVARLFIQAIKQLEIKTIDLLIGASMGGALVWQIAALEPDLCRVISPIACDYIASDWLQAQTHIQTLILQHSSHPLRDAREHAMLCYRTPQSINERFKNSHVPQASIPKVCDWLDYHGRTLEERFRLSAYEIMTYLTSSIHVASSPIGLKHINSVIHLISIDSDLLFPHYRAEETVRSLQDLGQSITLHTIQSVHGHDAFLMEYDQLCHHISNIITSQ